MSTFLLLALLLSIINYSSGLYCVCNQGVSDTLLQENIDYACGKADCSAIQKTGSCYLPNTVKAHCDYAVNIYYQKMNQVTGSCSFSGTANTTATLSSTLGSGCTYPASPSDVTSSSPTSNSSTPTTTPTTPTTPTTSTTPTTAITPSTSTTIPSTSSTGSTAFDSGPSGSFSEGSTIDPNSMSSALITLFLSGLLLALWS